jgi:hypothetical protein
MEGHWKKKKKSYYPLRSCPPTSYTEVPSILIHRPSKIPEEEEVTSN